MKSEKGKLNNKNSVFKNIVSSVNSYNKTIDRQKKIKRENKRSRSRERSNKKSKKSEME
jgi:hypothetical protein